MFFNIAITVAALWLLFVASIMNTKTLVTALIYKISPSILGVILLIFSMKQFNLL